MTEVVVPPLLPTVVPGTVANGIYTVIGPRGHRTLKLITVQEGPLAGRRIVYVMTGPDNVFHYTGVAFLETVDQEIEEGYEEESVDEFGAVSTEIKRRKVTKPIDKLQIWKRMQGTELHKVAQAWLRIVTVGIDGYRYELAKNCIKCNKRLTHPESIESGIGPICAQGGTDV